MRLFLCLFLTTAITACSGSTAKPPSKNTVLFFGDSITRETIIVAVAFGTNDAYDMRLSVADFEHHLGMIVDLAMADGRKVYLPTIPYSPLKNLSRTPLYNAAIGRIIAVKGCKAGPDLFAWFQAHPDQLSMDNTHPNQTGFESINRLWAETLRQGRSAGPSSPEGRRKGRTSPRGAYFFCDRV